MNLAAFEELWQRHVDFKFERAEDEEKCCIYARHFAAWAETLYQDEVNQPTHIGINQKMLLLTKKYFEWRTAVPKAHRDRMAERGHTCIFHVFERTYHHLMVLELALTPPMLFLPAKPPRPPKPPPPAPVLKLPEKLERLLGDFAINEILGEEP